MSFLSFFHRTVFMLQMYYKRMKKQKMPENLCCAATGYHFFLAFSAPVWN